MHQLAWAKELKGRELLLINFMKFAVIKAATRRSALHVTQTSCQKQRLLQQCTTTMRLLLTAA